MMNWKDYLNYLIILKKLFSKILFLTLISFTIISAQTEQDSLVNVESSVVKKEMTKSPWGALLRSAVLPGLGQIYNESYWKAPVIWGIFASQTYFYIKNNKTYHSEIEKIKNGDTSRIRFRDSARDVRDQILLWGVIVYFIQLVDAYVDAHLFDFDVSENPFTNEPEINLKINF